MRCLELIGIEANTYGALLLPVLLAKLPQDLHLIVSRKVSDSNLNIGVLLEMFEQEPMARERATPQHTQPSKGNSLFVLSVDNPSSRCTTVVDVTTCKSILKSRADASTLCARVTSRVPVCLCPSASGAVGSITPLFVITVGSRSNLPA